MALEMNIKHFQNFKREKTQTFIRVFEKIYTQSFPDPDITIGMKEGWVIFYYGNYPILKYTL